MEKLRINNFAGLKSVELEIPPVLGLIGPQASGKSIIAKLLYFFRQIASRLPNGVLIGQDGPQYKADCLKRFSRYFPIENPELADFEITYVIKDQQVRVKFAKLKGAESPSLGLEWSNIYDEVLEKRGNQRIDMVSSSGDFAEFKTAYNALSDDVERDILKALGPCGNFEQIFIPAGRAFFSQVQSTIFTQFAEGESPEPFMAEFGALLERTKSSLELGGYFDPTSGEIAMPDSLQDEIEKILHAQFRRVERQEFLEFTGGRRVKLAQASSGQQEALPLLVLLAQSVLLPHKRGRVVYIEEPEAHLFPSAQKFITELIAQVFRAWEGNMSLVLTTHSPYILTSVNNLLQAEKLYWGASKEAAARLARIIPRMRTFRPGEVAFYALQDGNATSIVNPETSLIEADMIDQVSNDIAIQFDELLSEGNEKS